MQNEREFQDVTVDMYADLIKNDEDRKKVENILMIYECEKYETGMVPSKLSIIQMEKFLTLGCEDYRKSFHLLLKHEITRWIRKKGKPTFGEDTRGYTLSSIYYDENTGAPFYGSWRISYLIRVRRREMRLASVFQALAAQQFNQKLIFDCGYEHEGPYLPATAMHLIEGIHENYLSPEPFRAVVTNFKKDSPLGTTFNRMKELSPNLFDLTDFREGSFTDYFSNEKLIYLSPYSPNYLESFDPEATYIVGSYLCSGKRLSMTKSVKYNIPHYRFPIDKYVTLRLSKILNLGLATKIIGHLKYHNDIRRCITECIPENMLASSAFVSSVQKDRFIRMDKYKKHNQLADILLAEVRKSKTL